jgi:hypothetical protein
MIKPETPPKPDGVAIPPQPVPGAITGGTENSADPQVSVRLLPPQWSTWISSLFVVCDAHLSTISSSKNRSGSGFRVQG